ncbi:MAG: formate dehydrogenase accessory protein [Virus sp.]|nr:MAG: formate dehydrogenase accessory protein [Virus sp.]
MKLPEEDRLGSGMIHCLDCGLSADVKASDMAAWKALGCPECGEGVNAQIDIGTGRGSIDTAVHNDDGSITCTFCEGEIHMAWQEDEEGNLTGTIMRASSVEIEDCPSCDRAFKRMRSEGLI